MPCYSSQEMFTKTFFMQKILANVGIEMETKVFGFLSCLLLVCFLSLTINVPMTQAESGVLRVPDEYLTIQSAINAANSGDTVFVGSGKYYEAVYVNKSVSIIGDSPSTTTVYGVDGTGSDPEGYVFYVTASDVTLANMTIRNGDSCAVSIKPGSNYVIQNNIIMSSDSGISCLGCSNISIVGNTLTDLHGWVVHLQSCHNGIVSGNTLSENDPMYGIALDSASNFEIVDNVVTGSHRGIRLGSSSDNIISGNQLSGNGEVCIELENSRMNTIMNNEIEAGSRGLSISESPNCLVRNNTITGGRSNFGVFGYEVEDFEVDVDTSNTVNGKPIYYLIDKSDLVINSETYPDVGYLGLVNSRNITVEGLILENNLQGILLAHTSDSLITNNTLTGNSDTIYLINQSDRNTISFNQIDTYSTGVRTYFSSETIIVGNNISYGTNGVWLDQSSNNKIVGNTISINYENIHFVNTENNTIYHNNFESNTISHGSWDSDNWNISYPSGGNYWGKNGTDVNMGVSQGQLGSDGIIDEALMNRDHYPLFAPVQMFEVVVANGERFYAELVCNSTLTAAYVTADGFNLSMSGPTGTAGFCRITIPNSFIEDVWNSNYTIQLNGVAQPFRNATDSQNTYIYLSYLHPASQIIVVPEFPVDLAFVLVLLVVSTLMVVAFKNGLVNTSKVT
ncbi:MAG: hypothetical protein CW716_02240 [Candidatus Bathyarchaeum sp.]|nr:MAG: hypothetical protein CW716_02240 [Candidatus Bathyarchaeum sp.]